MIFNYKCSSYRVTLNLSVFIIERDNNSTLIALNSIVLNEWLNDNIACLGRRPFISTGPLVHKHVKMRVGKWILETTPPHKHVQIPEDKMFLFFLNLAQLFSSENFNSNYWIFQPMQWIVADTDT